MEVLLAHPDSRLVDLLAQTLPGARVRHAATLDQAVAALDPSLELVVVAATFPGGVGSELIEELPARGVRALAVILPREGAGAALARALALAWPGAGPPPGTGDLVLDSLQAATYLGIDKRNLRELARKGRVPAFRGGRRWRFRKDALDQWLLVVSGPEAGSEQ